MQGVGGDRVDTASNGETLPFLVALEGRRELAAIVAVDVAKVEISLSQFLLELADLFVCPGWSRDAEATSHQYEEEDTQHRILRIV
jgi:hypothetical protein